LEPTAHFQLAQKISGLLADLPQVEAVALGGSRGSASLASDPASDIDLYVYTRAEVSLAARQVIIEQAGGASQVNLGLEYWGPGDEWFHAPSAIEIDLVYFDAGWMEEQLRRVLVLHQAAQGYSTCFWHTVRQSVVLHDPRGWFASLQRDCLIDYPESLRRNIITLNHPLLRSIIPAYAHQLEKAVRRRDWVSLNHRLAALLASYFDILFALNRLPHPGEKRMLTFALQRCTLLPNHLEEDLNSLLLVSPHEVEDIPIRLARLLDNLDELIAREGLLLPT
jgi:hypothetical protein